MSYYADYFSNGASFEGQISADRPRQTITRPETKTPTYNGATSTSIVLHEITIDFPYKPYQAQLDYMESVIRALNASGCNAILESPTGTGKTLCLLCSSLAWQQAQKQRPTIIYASRTHAQLAQVVSELRKTKYASSIKSVTLGSREQLCVQPTVKCLGSSSAIQTACRTAIKTHTCLYHRPPGHPQPTRAPVLDIEDLRYFGETQYHCPFFLSRDFAAGSDLVLMPYNYFLDKQALDSLKIDLRGSILIIDEAHNIAQRCEESSSIELSHYDIRVAMEECDRISEFCMVSRGRTEAIDDIANVPQTEKQINPKDITTAEQLSKLAASVQTDNDILLLKKRCIDLEFALHNVKLTGVCPTSKKPEQAVSHAEALEILSSAGIDKTTVDNLRNCIIKAKLLVNGYPQELGSISAIEKLYEVLRTFFSTTTTSSAEYFEKHYRAFIQKGDTRDAVHGSEMRTLYVWCFSPAVAMRELVEEQKVRNIILTSGTLSPLGPLKQSLGIPFDVELQNKHVIDPETQLVAQILPNGPAGVTLNGNFKNRENPDYLSDLGSTVVNVSRMVPSGGILVAFHSYGQLEQCQAFWKQSGIWQRLGALKTLFVEPRHQNDMPAVLKSFQRITLSNNSSGAILFCVCRGKISEGVDLADQQCRAVILAGVPYPSLFDKKVVMKQKFLDEVTQCPGTGNIWYTTEAMRAVNQVIGRVIRHKDDFGVVLLCDERFCGQQHNLPGWIKSVLKVSPGFGQTIQDVSKFFQKYAHMQRTLPQNQPKSTADVMRSHNTEEAVMRAFAGIKRQNSEIDVPAIDMAPINESLKDIKKQFGFVGGKSFLTCKPGMVGSVRENADQNISTTSEKVSSAAAAKPTSSSTPWIERLKACFTAEENALFKTTLKNLKEAITNNLPTTPFLDTFARLLIHHNLHVGMTDMLPSSLRKDWADVCFRSTAKRPRM